MNWFETAVDELLDQLSSEADSNEEYIMALKRLREKVNQELAELEAA